jgi:hypothetical protein
MGIHCLPPGMSLTADHFISVKVVRQMQISLGACREAIWPRTCSQQKPVHFPTVLNFHLPSSATQRRHLVTGLVLPFLEVLIFTQRQLLPSRSTVSSTLISPLAFVASLLQDLLLPSL